MKRLSGALLCVVTPLFLAGCSSGSSPPSASYKAGYGQGVGYRNQFALEEGKTKGSFHVSESLADGRCRNAAGTTFVAHGYNLGQWLDGCIAAMQGAAMGS